MKKGYVSIELVLNFFIYLPIILILLQMSLLPLQVLLLEASLRKGVLIYEQLGHYSSTDLKEKLNEKGRGEILKFLPYVDFSKIETLSVEDIVKHYIKESFPKDTFAGKLINVDKIDIQILNNNTWLGNILKLVDTDEIKITISYRFSLFNLIDFGFKDAQGNYKGLSLKRSLVFRINP